jgi:hypothetical protein
MYVPRENLPAIGKTASHEVVMEHLEALRDPELEVELELLFAEEPDSEIEHEIIDDLDDTGFASGPQPAGDIYEIDPVHPLRRLSAWVRGRLAA